MGWTGSLTESSAVGESIRWDPNSPESTNPKTRWVDVKSYAGNYSVSSFTAPKRGVYEFDLRGSGGAKAFRHNDSSSNGLYDGEDGGTGGNTKGYLLLDKGQKVYIGAGGVCRAAFVSAVNGSSLSAISQANLIFVAGAGGSGAAFYDNHNETGYNCKVAGGGNGGGASGVAGTESMDEGAGGGGTQSEGGAAGESNASGMRANGNAGSRGLGGTGSSCNDDDHFQYKAYGARGGDGYYGGGGGSCSAAGNGLAAAGGGGGSGYVKNKTLTVVGKTYTSSTSKGGGASSNNAGSVTVTYYAVADIPVIFNGTRLTEIIFNGTRLTGLIKDGTRIFARWMGKRRKAVMA